MVLLLDGASASVRAAIALQAVKRHPHWQHLALESMKGALGTTKERAIHLRLIRQCVEELALQNMHLLLTLPAESKQTQEFALFLRPDVLTVHLGEAADGVFDCTIPLSTKLPDVLTVLDTHMQAA